MSDLSISDLREIDKAINRIDEVQEWLITHEFVDFDRDEFRIEVDDEHIDYFEEVNGYAQPPRNPELQDYEYYIKNWKAVRKYYLALLEQAENQIVKIQETHNALKELAIVEEL